MWKTHFRCRIGLLSIVLLLGTAAWSQTFQVLHSFNGSDGSEGGNLTWDGPNHIFGVSFQGGHCTTNQNGCGTVYEMTRTQGVWKFAVLYRFQGGVDGSSLISGVVLDAQKNVYGVTPEGGAFGKGTIFELSHYAGVWTKTTLYSFGAFSGDGIYPNYIVIDASGNLFGTTNYGGASGKACGKGCGAVWELAQNGTAWTESLLYSFPEKIGISPVGIAFDAKGNIYGTTQGGPTATGLGSVFELSPPSVVGGPWTETTLYSFTGGNDGGDPAAGVILDAAGNLYGTTATGGVHVNGTVFKLSSNAGGSWTFNVIRAFDFAVDGSDCRAGLAIDASGTIYGTTSAGGNSSSKSGTVFALAPNGGGTFAEQVLYTFTGGTDGFRPLNGVALDSAGNLYGTTGWNGEFGHGTLFEITP